MKKLTDEEAEDLHCFAAALQREEIIAWRKRHPRKERRAFFWRFVKAKLAEYKAPRGALAELRAVFEPDAPLHEASPYMFLLPSQRAKVRREEKKEAAKRRRRLDGLN